MSNRIIKNLKFDLPASLVVFLVALPLCLGIAIASGAPPLAGLIAGILGGIVVGSISGSHVSVSGPAAGLTTIVLNAITELGSFEIFLATLVAAGIIQFGLGIAKAGIIGYYFPTSVIKGMLTAIGLILILKQIPHALGSDKDFEGDFAFEQPDSKNTFTEIVDAFMHPSLGAIVILVASLLIIVIFEQKKIKNHKILGMVPSALLVVFAGIGLNELFRIVAPSLVLDGEHLVNIPVATNFEEMKGLLVFPDFSQIGTKSYWVIAFTIAIVGSIESLLSLEAADKIDPMKRSSPSNRELVAQGTANTISGFVGGLPVTAVIVRTTANIGAGAKSKMSAIFHGVLLLVLALAIPQMLNLIPLACLAAVLFQVGYKLAKPSIFVNVYQKGINQFVPFIVTVLAILFTDLLVGIGIGLVVGLFFVLKTNFKKTVVVTKHDSNYLVKLSKDAYFFNKAYLVKELMRIPDNSKVLISASTTNFIDADILEVLTNFIESAKGRNIGVKTEGFLDEETIFKAD